MAKIKKDEGRSMNNIGTLYKKIKDKVCISNPEIVFEDEEEELSHEACLDCEADTMKNISLILNEAKTDLENRIEKEKLDCIKRHRPGTTVDNSHVLLYIYRTWIKDWFDI